MDLFNEIANAIRPQKSLENHIKDLIHSFDGYEDGNYCKSEGLDHIEININYTFKYNGLEYLLEGEKIMTGKIIHGNNYYPTEIEWNYTANVDVCPIDENGIGKKIMEINI